MNYKHLQIQEVAGHKIKTQKVIHGE